MHLDCHRSRLFATRSGLPLCQTRCARVGLAVVLQITRMQPKQMTHLIVSLHLGNLLFDQLMIRDLRAKRLALVCISYRRISRGANYARRSGRHSVATLLERKHCNLKPLAFFTHHVRLRNAHILKRKITGVAGPNSQLAVNSARRKSFHASLDDETRHASVISFSSLLLISPAKE